MTGTRIFSGVWPCHISSSGVEMFLERLHGFCTWHAPKSTGKQWELLIWRAEPPFSSASTMQMHENTEKVMGATPPPLSRSPQHPPPIFRERRRKHRKLLYMKARIDMRFDRD